MAAQCHKKTNQTAEYLLYWKMWMLSFKQKVSTVVEDSQEYLLVLHCLPLSGNLLVLKL